MKGHRNRSVAEKGDDCDKKKNRMHHTDLATGLIEWGCTLNLMFFTLF